MENHKAALVPNYHLMRKFVDEADHLFKHYQNTSETQESVRILLDHRITEAIADGTWRTEFITADNQRAVFSHVALVIDPDNPTHIDIVPHWYYEEDDESEE